MFKNRRSYFFMASVLLCAAMAALPEPAARAEDSRNAGPAVSASTPIEGAPVFDFSGNAIIRKNGKLSGSRAGGKNRPAELESEKKVEEKEEKSLLGGERVLPPGRQRRDARQTFPEKTARPFDLPEPETWIKTHQKNDRGAPQTPRVNPEGEDIDYEGHIRSDHFEQERRRDQLERGGLIPDRDGRRSGTYLPHGAPGVPMR